MPRFIPAVLGCFLLAIPALAQRGGHSGGGGGFHGGAGGGMHAGGTGGFHGSSSGFHGGSSFRGGSGFRGGSHGGFRGNNGFRGGFRFRNNFGFPYYSYPAFYGGYYDPFFWDSGFDDSYGYGYPAYGYAAPDYNYAPPRQPPLIVQQQAPPPPERALREYVGPTEGAKANQALEKKKYEEPLYLIAMRDGAIRAVLAYWTNGPTLHYVTMDHEQKQAPLTSIDRGLSERLNHERNVTFTLPG